MLKNRSHKLLSRFLNLFIIAFLIASSSATNTTRYVYASSSYENEIRVVLEEYSNYLQTGDTQKHNYFLKSIDELLKDRRSYYKKFFDVALNSKLIESSSNYVLDDETLILVDSSTINIAISEEVKFIGKAKTKLVDEYPMIKAAKLASALADQQFAKNNKMLTTVKKELDAYADSTRDAIAESVNENYEITNIVRHEIVFSIDSDGIKIIQDSFSDQANDNLEGTDIVYWGNGQFYRIEPDMKASPDYIINNTPIEVLAENLLADTNQAASANAYAITAVAYNRTAAKNYANTWVRNTTYTCTGGSLFKNDDYYNHTQYPADYGCNECTNFVSQALVAGGIPTSAQWFYGPTSYRWLNVDGLRLELLDRGIASEVSSSSNLTIGDLGMIYSGGWQHVVMVVGLAPLRYSAHTNDRRSVNWSSTLNKYYHIN